MSSSFWGDDRRTILHPTKVVWSLKDINLFSLNSKFPFSSAYFSAISVSTLRNEITGLELEYIQAQQDPIFMVTASEKNSLKNLLKMTENPDATLSYDELLGYLFGLAMTPEMLVPSEWMPIIYGGELPQFDSVEQMQSMTDSLVQVYNNFISDFHNNKLKFPYELEKITESQLPKLYDWLSGFEEAISLREELWDPEEFPELPDRKKEELYHSMMTITGLVDPGEAMDFFESMPEELFKEVFADLDSENSSRETQVQLFLLSSLPLAISTLQGHAQTVEKKRQLRLAGQTFPSQARTGQVIRKEPGRNEPCPCNSGKKYKKCCGNTDQRQSFHPSDIARKKSNVIKVDFPQHGKKRPAGPAPVYQLKVSLKGAKPPIWRRIQVPGNITLEKLHDIIQTSMGWQDMHLHMFIIGNEVYRLPEEDDLYMTEKPKNETRYTLQQLKNKIQDTFTYIYDFGDNWIHQVELEKILPEGEGKPSPCLLAGRRACPPEDIGGLHSYQHLLTVMADPKHEDYEDYQEIVESMRLEAFDPALFNKEDIQEINSILLELTPQKK